MASIKTIREAILRSQAEQALSLLPPISPTEEGELRFCRICIEYETNPGNQTIQSLEEFDLEETSSTELLVHMVRSIALKRKNTPQGTSANSNQISNMSLAIKLLHRTLELAPEDEYVCKIAFELSDHLSWYQDACKHLQTLIRLKPQDNPLHLRAARYYLAHGDPHGAIELLQASPLMEDKDPDGLFLYAQLLVQTDQKKAAIQAIGNALEARPTDWHTAVQLYVSIGAIEKAEETTHQAPHGADRDATLGRFALWKLDLKTARLHMEKALEQDPEHPMGSFVQGVVFLLENDSDQALKILRKVEDKLPPQQGGTNHWLSLDAVLTWQSELHRYAGNFQEALRLADRAKSTGAGFGLLAYLNRLLALTHQGQLQGNQVMGPDVWRPVLSKLETLLPEQALENLSSPTQVQEVAEGALARFGGNRSSYPTLLHHGKLSSFETPPHPRQLGRMLQHLLRTQSQSHVLQRFQEHHERFPEDATTLTYWGETLLWLGHYPEAAQRFQEAIALHRPTTWAWIGLGASMLLTQDFEGARTTWNEGVKAARFRGPTLYIYEGEMLRKTGEFEAARIRLDHALTTKPERISTWINRALLSNSLGNEEPLAFLAQWIQTQCPGMWMDVSAAANIPATSLAEPSIRFELLLEMMRGNRSSALGSYFVGENTLRFGRWKHPNLNEIVF